jgi:ketosteroid isomerase-like protein
MSEENVETVRRGIEAFNRRDFDTALTYVRDDVSWERFLSRAETTAPVVRGKEQLRAAWESQVEAVDLRAEPEAFIPVGDKVVVPMLMAARGSASEISLKVSVVWVCSFGDDGLVASVAAFESREDALKAAGLPA